jgi:hypothetical protein
MNLDLLDTQVKKDIISRINLLQSTSAPLWGKMTVSQMLAHCQAQMGVALGETQVTSSVVSRLFGGWIKKMVINEKPFSKNLPTAPAFVVRHDPEFETEKSKLIDMLGRFTKENIKNQPHPIFGKLTLDEWSKGTWKHIDHHLKQFGV